MNRKNKIILIASSVGVASFAIGIPTAIALKNHEKDFSVALNASNKAHYLILKINPSSNKAETVDKDFIWDVKTDDNIKSSISEIYNIEPLQVVTTINKSNKWSDGLEKLLYDLLNIHNNGKSMKLVFPNTINIGNKKTNKLTFDNSFINPKGNKKQQIAARHSMLTDNGKFNANLLKFVQGIKIYKSSTSIAKSSKANIKTTTKADFDAALAKMLQASS